MAATSKNQMRDEWEEIYNGNAECAHCLNMDCDGYSCSESEYETELGKNYAQGPTPEKWEKLCSSSPNDVGSDSECTSDEDLLDEEGTYCINIPRSNEAWYEHDTTGLSHLLSKMVQELQIKIADIYEEDMSVGQFNHITIKDVKDVINYYMQRFEQNHMRYYPESHEEYMFLVRMGDTMIQIKQEILDDLWYRFYHIHGTRIPENHSDSESQDSHSDDAEGQNHTYSCEDSDTECDEGDYNDSDYPHEDNDVYDCQYSTHTQSNSIEDEDGLHESHEQETYKNHSCEQHQCLENGDDGSTEWSDDLSDNQEDCNSQCCESDCDSQCCETDQTFTSYCTDETDIQETDSAEHYPRMGYESDDESSDDETILSEEFQDISSGDISCEESPNDTSCEDLTQNRILRRMYGEVNLSDEPHADMEIPEELQSAIEIIQPTQVHYAAEEAIVPAQVHYVAEETIVAAQTYTTTEEITHPNIIHCDRPYCTNEMAETGANDVNDDASKTNPALTHCEILQDAQAGVTKMPDDHEDEVTYHDCYDSDDTIVEDEEKVHQPQRSKSKQCHRKYGTMSYLWMSTLTLLTVIALVTPTAHVNAHSVNGQSYGNIDAVMKWQCSRMEIWTWNQDMPMYWNMVFLDNDGRLRPKSRAVYLTGHSSDSKFLQGTLDKDHVQHPCFQHGRGYPPTRP